MNNILDELNQYTVGQIDLNNFNPEKKYFIFHSIVFNADREIYIEIYSNGKLPIANLNDFYLLNEQFNADTVKEIFYNFCQNNLNHKTIQNKNIYLNVSKSKYCFGEIGNNDVCSMFKTNNNSIKFVQETNLDNYENILNLNYEIIILVVKF